MIECGPSRLERVAPIPRVSGSAGEREHPALTLLVQRPLVPKVEAALRVGNRDPLGRRIRVGTQIAVGVIPLTEAGQDDIVQTPDTFQPTHRFRRCLEQRAGRTLLSRRAARKRQNAEQTQP